MISSGFISRLQSEWASPVVLIPKPDGSLCFCVDYRRLNAMTVRDTYPIPRMDECLDSLGEANVFTTLDCNSGYWQIPVAEEDRPKTTFTCHAGTYQFNRMPFGLMNAPATFQRMLDILLSGYRWKSCLIYLDDIIIFSNDSSNFYLWATQFAMHVADLTTNNRKVLLILDGYRSHMSVQTLHLYNAHRVILYALPAHTSGKTQPLDVTVFSPF